MTKLAILIATLWVLYKVIRRLVARSHGSEEINIGHMVRCLFCNTYVSQDDAFRKGDDYYCSEDHYLQLTKKNST